ncbi:hypothetical protein [Bradyrhizobium sp. USDA 3458]|uniref:hypothetical protein n=1 Tax=Bradyrhizobium sp. USDA 3458 TaxID=2591461 RepID=UPI0011412BCA|nr:hypothetical protein [Bradyrhizobium sp. USDA 3458]
MPQLTRRLPNSSGGGEPPQSTIDPETWDKVISLSGRNLSAAQIGMLRSDLERAISRYRLNVGMATSAPVLDRNGKQLRKIRQALLMLIPLLEGLQVGDEGDLYTGLIEHHVFRAHDWHGTLTEFFDDTRKYNDHTREYEPKARAVSEACNTALKTLAISGAGLQATRMWAVWVRETARAWRKYDLPVAARHDGDPQTSDFVTLIDILQSSLPKCYRHHIGSTALVSAVRRALKESPVSADFSDRKKGAR